MNNAALDYLRVREAAVVALGNAAENGNAGTQNLKIFLEQNDVNCPAAWVEQIARDLNSAGLGNATFSPFAISFHQSGASIIAAKEIQSQRTVLGRLRRVSRSDWIALIALAVSLIALFKS